MVTSSIEKCVRVVPNIGRRWSLCANENPDKNYSWCQTCYAFEQRMGCNCALYYFFACHMGLEMCSFLANFTLLGGCYFTVYSCLIWHSVLAVLRNTAAAVLRCLKMMHLVYLVLIRDRQASNAT